MCACMNNYPFRNVDKINSKNELVKGEYMNTKLILLYNYELKVSNVLKCEHAQMQLARLV